MSIKYHEMNSSGENKAQQPKIKAIAGGGGSLGSEEPPKVHQLQKAH